ncbi:heparinase II/III domain-containing protein [Salinicoccus roseus]|uniref:heparinase II/III domain-containing protein n=1 Tax=Salinicoccus roseus TaxID=45670 RepID=UPI0022FFEF8B|nr:heparinase II/III family protein [Salinicoccus roseus]
MDLNFDAHKTALLKRNIQQNRQYAAYADELLEGRYRLHPNVGVLVFEDGIEWSFQTEKNPRTTQIYLHSMNYLNYLVYAHNETGEGKYLEKGKEILSHWHEHHAGMEKRETNNNLAWNEHAVSSRAINALWLKAHAPDTLEADGQFTSFIKHHLEFLTDNANYTENNHGIMMDKAVLIIALFLADAEEKKPYITIAKKRLEKVLMRDFSYRHVHLENSPEYHRIVVKWFAELAKILKEMDAGFHRTYYNKIKRAKDYLGYVIDYNHQLPLLGDTGIVNVSVDKVHDDFFDAEAGIGIFNDETKCSTLLFSAGFQNNTHKHQDDLSLIFSVNKESILADSGKYSYAKDDPFRTHLTSPAAHTTLRVEGEDYPLDILGDIRLTNYHTSSRYKYVSGEHHMYEGTALKRHVILIDGDKLIIVDDALSEKPKNFIQNFVLDDSVEVEQVNRDMMKLSTPDNTYILKSHLGEAESRIFHGKEDKAVISKKFGKLIETHRIEISKAGDDTRFFTSLVPEGDEVTLNASDYEAISFDINGRTFEIPLDTLDRRVDE